MKEETPIIRKMDSVFNDALKNNEILSLNEKKVLASLLYSWQRSSEAKNNGVLIRPISKIREDTAIKMNYLYDALYNLEFLYGMIERKKIPYEIGAKRGMVNTFKLNFKRIFNPPIEVVKFDFSEELKSPETSMGNIDIDIDIDKDIHTDIDIDKEKEIETDIDIHTDTDIDTDKDIDIDTDKDIDIHTDTDNGKAIEIDINKEIDIHTDMDTHAAVKLDMNKIFLDVNDF